MLTSSSGISVVCDDIDSEGSNMVSRCFQGASKWSPVFSNSVVGWAELDRNHTFYIKCKKVVQFVM